MTNYLGASASLGQRSIRGAAITGVGQATIFALRFGATAILARLLSPADYGLVAMATVSVGFAAVFMDAGLASATVQREQVTHGQISTLFWFNAGLGCLIAVVLIAAAPVVASGLRDPRLSGVICALSVTCILGGMSVQHLALLRRQMRFGTLTAIGVSATLAGVSISIIMAAEGFGYWSLLGTPIGHAVVQAVGVWGFARFRPGLPRRQTGARPMLKFGADIVSADVVAYLTVQADKVLLGRYWGAAALGLYDKAHALLLFPISQVNGPLTAVLMPALSRVKDDVTRFSGLFLNAVELVSGVIFPIVLGIAVFADDIVFFWLGPGWAETAVMFRLLAIAAIGRAMMHPMGWVLITQGKTRRHRQLGFINGTVIVSSFVLGLPYGAKGVAASYSAAVLLLIVPAWWFVLLGSGIRPYSLLRSVVPALVSGIFAALVGVALKPVAGVVAAVSAFVGVYALVLLLGFDRKKLLHQAVAALMP